MSEIESRDACPDCGGELCRERGTTANGVCPDCGWTGNLYYAVSDDE